MGGKHMRKALVGLFVAALSLAATGCLMVIGVERPVLDGKKRIIEVDDELYIVDVEQSTVRKMDKDAAIEVTVDED